MGRIDIGQEAKEAKIPANNRLKEEELEKLMAMLEMVEIVLTLSQEKIEIFRSKALSEEDGGCHEFITALCDFALKQKEGFPPAANVKNFKTTKATLWSGTDQSSMGQMVEEIDSKESFTLAGFLCIKLLDCCKDKYQRLKATTGQARFYKLVFDNHNVYEWQGKHEVHLGKGGNLYIAILPFGRIEKLENPKELADSKGQ